MSMMNPELKTEVQKMIDASMVRSFATKKIGDTPTDALQLVPKKYVDTKSGFTIASSSTSFKIGGVIGDHYTDAGNTGTSETDLYSDTLPASILANAGDMIQTEYGGLFVSSGTATRQVRIYFGGNLIFDTGALTLSLSSAWTCYATFMRVDSANVRYMVSFTTEGAALAAYTATGSLGSLNLSNANIIKITGQAAGVGAATNDIVAKLGAAWYYPSI